MTGGPLFCGVAALAALALVFAILTFEDDPAQDPSAPWDLTALVLAVVGSVAAFVGAGRLEATMTADVSSLGPLIGGAALIVLLVVHEYRRDNPLMPVRAATTSMPVTGIFIALTSRPRCGSASPWPRSASSEVPSSTSPGAGDCRVRTSNAGRTRVSPPGSHHPSSTAPAPRRGR